MGCIKELSIGGNSDLSFLSIQENILTSINYEEKERKFMELSTTGLGHAERIITELLKYEQDNYEDTKKKSFTLLQVLILIRLAKLSKKGIKYENLHDLTADFGLDNLEIPDFKMSRNANNLSAGRVSDAKGKPTVEGWGLCDMNVSPENKRWQTITLNKKGWSLVKKLSEGSN